MARIVSESIEAIMIVYDKLKSIKDLDGLESSVNLLPKSLVSPYEEPLGNQTLVP
jgi:hypothetical protein